MQSARVYVEVTVDFDAAGRMYPRTITWEDGLRYPIDRVRAIRPAHAERGGGMGDRYTVLVSGRETYLFFERGSDPETQCTGRWFVERRQID